MRKISSSISAIILLLTASQMFSQTVYEPQILILAPNKSKYEKVFTKELEKKNKEIAGKTISEEKEMEYSSSVRSNQPENLQSTLKSSIEYSKRMDFFKNTSLLIQSVLIYRFYERFPNLLIKVKDAKSNGTLKDLKKYSEQEKLQYVLNISSIELYKEDEMSYCKMTLQLYDNASDIVVLDKTYKGHWLSPGFEFGCDNETIDCCINNVLSQASGEIVYHIASNSPTLKKERDLYAKRFDILVKNHLSVPFDKKALYKIISQKDTTINTDIVFQLLFNSDKTKFTAFFLKSVSVQDFKRLRENKHDRNVTIINSKEINDPNYLNDIPQTYAYIVKGVNHEGKWYYEKDHTTYFEAVNEEDGQQKFFNNLQKWNFFKDGMTELNPDFWESNLFEKVPDLRKDPKWEKYGENMWKSEEYHNRSYIGLYRIVANRLQSENEEVKDAKELSIFQRYILPLKKKLNNDTAYHIKPMTKFDKEYLEIYPPDWKVILCPMSIKGNGKSPYIRYFVLSIQADSTYKTYEWNYLKQSDFSTKVSDPNLVTQLGTITEWNYSYDYLTDDKFWNDFVFAKAGDAFKYLKEIK